MFEAPEAPGFSEVKMVIGQTSGFIKLKGSSACFETWFYSIEIQTPSDFLLRSLAASMQRDFGFTGRIDCCKLYQVTFYFERRDRHL